MKKAMVSAVLVACVVFDFSSVSAKDTGVLGLKWGMSPQEVKKAGTRMSVLVEEAGMVGYGALSVPKEVPKAAQYLLIFSEQYGLVKAVVYYRKITDDESGAEGRRNFAIIEDVLRKKYGNPLTLKTVSAKPLGKYNKFYTRLKAGDSGDWAVLFKAKTVTAFMEIEGHSPGCGQIVLSFEAHPGWGLAMKKKEERIKAESASAF